MHGWLGCTLKPKAQGLLLWFECLLPTLLGAVSRAASRVIGTQFLLESCEQLVSLKAAEVGAGWPLGFESGGRPWPGFAYQLAKGLRFQVLGLGLGLGFRV